MTSIYYFGSDQYSSVVYDYLTEHSQLNITRFPHLSNLSSIPPGSIGLSASFPHLFPPDIIATFNGQLYNLHPSLLPQYRNVAPVPYAIAMGDTETGITLQRIDEKIDHGEIIAQQSEPILPTDTTPTLLSRLFTLGAQLFLDQLQSDHKSYLLNPRSEPLIFTRKLTGESGYLEWPTTLKLIHNQPITISDTANSLLKLRLTHHPDRTHNMLPDLIRALEGYEKVWSISPSRKGDLRISFVLTPPSEIRVLLPGKPRPIAWTDFQKYYL